MGKIEKTHAEKTLATDLGQKANVDRHQISNKAIGLCNKQLNEIGKALVPMRELTYHGSVAIHIYSSNMLKVPFFVSQTDPLRKTDETLASIAHTNLQGDMMEYFGRIRKKRRSGF